MRMSVKFRISIRNTVSDSPTGLAPDSCATGQGGRLAGTCPIVQAVSRGRRYTRSSLCEECPTAKSRSRTRFNQNTTLARFDSIVPCMFVLQGKASLDQLIRWCLIDPLSSQFFSRRARAHSWASELATIRRYRGIGIVGREGFWALVWLSDWHSKWNRIIDQSY